MLSIKISTPPGGVHSVLRSTDRTPLRRGLRGDYPEEEGYLSISRQSMNADLRVEMLFTEAC